jgi:uncharacterized damage-inducible protein DinB
MNRTELIKSFVSGAERLVQAVEVIPKEAYDYKPSPAAWSIREIIIHMPDSEASGFVRCRKIIAQSGVTVDVYDQDAWADKLNYAQADMNDALVLFAQMRRATIALLDNLDESVWTENFVMHPEDGKVNLECWLEMYAVHVDKHLEQIQHNVSAWEKAGRP